MNIVKAKTQTEINKCVEIRMTVFVKEQGVPIELEADEFDFEDAACTHFMIYENEDLIGTFRIISEKENEAHFQRFCILKEFRGKNFGRLSLQYAEKFCKEQGYEKITMNSQCYAIEFYKKCGFIVVSDEFDDAGIPHVAMEKNIDGGFKKKKQLFLNQKELLDTFLRNGAISQTQHNKSYGDLVVKMGMEDVANEL